MATLDIFQGHYGDENAIWIEAVDGLAAARKRMEEVALHRPGAYFVFSANDGLVLAIVNTAERSIPAAERSKGASGS